MWSLHHVLLMFNVLTLIFMTIVSSNSNVSNSCLTHSWCLTLPLFVAEIQNPLHVLLGHWVIIFQRLKREQNTFLFFEERKTNTKMRLMTKHWGNTGETNILCTIHLWFKIYLGFSKLQVHSRQKKVSSFNVNYGSHRGIKGKRIGK